MGAETLDDARLILQTLVTALNAAPIPDLFKPAVTLVPELALNIIASAQVTCEHCTQREFVKLTSLFDSSQNGTKRMQQPWPSSSGM